MFENYRLIEVWVTKGTKNKPETRTSKHTYYDSKEDAFNALQAATGDMNRLLHNESHHRQVWYQ